MEIYIKGESKNIKVYRGKDLQHYFIYKEKLFILVDLQDIEDYILENLHQYTKKFDFLDYEMHRKAFKDKTLFTLVSKPYFTKLEKTAIKKFLNYRIKNPLATDLAVTDGFEANSVEINTAKKFIKELKNL